MLKQFLKDSLVYGVGGLVTRAISVLLVPFYTRVFAPDDYGVIDLIAVASIVVNSLFSLEITQAIARFYPDTKDERVAREYASTALFFTLGAFVIFLVGTLLLGEQLRSFVFGNEVSLVLIRVAALSITLNALFYFVQNQLRWRLEPARHAVCSLLFSITAVTLTIVLVLVFHTGVIGVFWAQSIASLVALILGFYYSRSSYITAFHVARLKEMLAFSLPIVPSSIGIFALTYADRITIAGVLSFHELGVFGIGARVASVVALLLMGFQSAITPLIYTHYREAGTPAELARIFRYFVLLALVVCVALSVLGKEILIILTTPQYYGGAIVIPFLVVSTFLYGMYVFAPGLGIVKKTGIIAAINVVGAVLNVVLNIILVRSFGILGAATATLVASIFVFSGFMYFSQKFYFVPHETGKLILGVCAAVIFGTVGVMLTPSSIAVSIVVKGILLVMFLGTLIGVRLFTLDEVRHAFNKLRVRTG